MARTLYVHRLSTASRPVLLLCEEAQIEAEIKVVDLMAGEQFEAEYRAVNPCSQVPSLVEDDFVLTESSAIMKYLAEEVGSALYPTGLRERARVNERMDWFNTGFYRDWGYHFIYPQAFEHLGFQPPECNDAVIGHGIEKAKRWMGILNDCYLAQGDYVAGSEPTIADLFGAAIVSMGEWIGQGVGAWPNVERWMGSIQSRPSWARVHEAHEGFVSSLAGGEFRTID